MRSFLGAGLLNFFGLLFFFTMLVPSASAAPPSLVSFTVSPTAGTPSTNITYILLTSGALSCEVKVNGITKIDKSSGTTFVNTTPGAPEAVGSYTYNTTCWTGLNGTGESATDTDTLTITAGGPGACGTGQSSLLSNGGLLSAMPASELCSAGTWGGWGTSQPYFSTDSIDASGNHIESPGGYRYGWFWKCNSSTGGGNAGCWGYTDAACGSANNGTFSSTSPPEDPSSAFTQNVLCSVGVPSSVTVSSPTTYSWSCLPSLPTARCTANRTAAAVPTAQITARGPVASAPEGFWKKFFSFIFGDDQIAKASGPDARITVGEKAQIDWGPTAGSMDSCRVEKVGTPGNVSTSLSGSRVLSGLTAGTHTYKLICSKTGFTIPDDIVNVIVDTPGPSGPGDPPGSGAGSYFTATPGACGTYRIDVAWNTVAGATSYQLRDGGTQIYSGASTSYSHTGLAASSSHNYDVRATNGSGSSAWQSAISSTAPALCAVVCGDGSCNGGELCSTCSSDCGVCGPTFTILSAAGAGGSIAPSGAAVVNSGSSQSYTITPNVGYSIASIRVDGTNVGAVGSYTFNNVLANHVIDADFSGGPPPFCGDSACNNGETCATCSGDCGSCAAASLRICPTSATVFPGTTQPFKVWYNPAGVSFTGCGSPNGTDTTAAATWTSFDPAKVSVVAGSPGLVRGGATLGSTVIRAEWGVYSDSATVNNVSPPCSAKTCGDFPADSAKVCTGNTYAIGDGCSGILTCSGTRDCDYNWKEISPY